MHAQCHTVGVDPQGRASPTECRCLSVVVQCEVQYVFASCHGMMPSSGSVHCDVRYGLNLCLLLD